MTVPTTLRAYASFTVPRSEVRGYQTSIIIAHPLSTPADVDITGQFRLSQVTDVTSHLLPPVTGSEQNFTINPVGDRQSVTITWERDLADIFPDEPDGDLTITIQYRDSAINQSFDASGTAIPLAIEIALDQLVLRQKTLSEDLDMALKLARPLSNPDNVADPYPLPGESRRPLVNRDGFIAVQNGEFAVVEAPEGEDLTLEGQLLANNNLELTLGDNTPIEIDLSALDVAGGITDTWAMSLANTTLTVTDGTNSIDTDLAPLLDGIVTIVGTDDIEDDAVTEAKLSQGVRDQLAAGGEERGKTVLGTVNPFPLTAAQQVMSGTDGDPIVIETGRDYEIYIEMLGGNRNNGTAYSVISGDRILAGLVEVPLAENRHANVAVNTDSQLTIGVQNATGLAGDAFVQVSLISQIAQTVIVEGDSTGITEVNTDDIVDGAVTTPKLANQAVTAAKIAGQAVGNLQLAPDSVSTNRILANAVTEDRIRDSSIATNKIQAGAVTTSRIANNAVTAGQIADDAIGSRHIVDGAVGDAAIHDESVTADKLAADVTNRLDGFLTSVSTADIVAGAVTEEKLSQDVRNQLGRGDGVGTGLTAEQQEILESFVVEHDSLSVATIDERQAREIFTPRVVNAGAPGVDATTEDILGTREGMLVQGFTSQNFLPERALGTPTGFPWRQHTDPADSEASTRLRALLRVAAIKGINDLMRGANPASLGLNLITNLNHYMRANTDHRDTMKIYAVISKTGAMRNSFEWMHIEDTTIATGTGTEPSTGHSTRAYTATTEEVGQVDWVFIPFRDMTADNLGFFDFDWVNFQDVELLAMNLQTGGTYLLHTDPTPTDTNEGERVFVASIHDLIALGASYPVKLDVLKLRRDLNTLAADKQDKWLAPGTRVPRAFTSGGTPENVRVLPGNAQRGALITNYENLWQIDGYTSEFPFDVVNCSASLSGVELDFFALHRANRDPNEPTDYYAYFISGGSGGNLQFGVIPEEIDVTIGEETYTLTRTGTDFDDGGVIRNTQGGFPYPTQDSRVTYQLASGQIPSTGTVNNIVARGGDGSVRLSVPGAGFFPALRAHTGAIYPQLEVDTSDIASALWRNDGTLEAPDWVKFYEKAVIPEANDMSVRPTIYYEDANTVTGTFLGANNVQAGDLVITRTEAVRIVTIDRTDAGVVSDFSSIVQHDLSQLSAVRTNTNNITHNRNNIKSVGQEVERNTEELASLSLEGFYPPEGSPSDPTPAFFVPGRIQGYWGIVDCSGQDTTALSLHRQVDIEFGYDTDHWVSSYSAANVARGRYNGNPAGFFIVFEKGGRSVLLIPNTYDAASNMYRTASNGNRNIPRNLTFNAVGGTQHVFEVLSGDPDPISLQARVRERNRTEVGGPWAEADPEESKWIRYPLGDSAVALTEKIIREGFTSITTHSDGSGAEIGVTHTGVTLPGQPYVEADPGDEYDERSASDDTHVKTWRLGDDFVWAEEIDQGLRKANEVESEVERLNDLLGYTDNPFVKNTYTRFRPEHRVPGDYLGSSRAIPTGVSESYIISNEGVVYRKSDHAIIGWFNKSVGGHTHTNFSYLHEFIDGTSTVLVAVSHTNFTDETKVFRARVVRLTGEPPTFTLDQIRGGMGQFTSIDSGPATYFGDGGTNASEILTRGYDILAGLMVCKNTGNANIPVAVPFISGISNSSPYQMQAWRLDLVDNEFQNVEAAVDLPFTIGEGAISGMVTDFANTNEANDTSFISFVRNRELFKRDIELTGTAENVRPDIPEALTTEATPTRSLNSEGMPPNIPAYAIVTEGVTGVGPAGSEDVTFAASGQLDASRNGAPVAAALYRALGNAMTLLVEGAWTAQQRPETITVVQGGVSTTYTVPETSSPRNIIVEGRGAVEGTRWTLGPPFSPGFTDDSLITSIDAVGPELVLLPRTLRENESLTPLDTESTVDGLYTVYDSLGELNTFDVSTFLGIYGYSNVGVVEQVTRNKDAIAELQRARGGGTPGVDVTLLGSVASLANTTWTNITLTKDGNPFYVKNQNELVSMLRSGDVLEIEVVGTTVEEGTVRYGRRSVYATVAQIDRLTDFGGGAADENPNTTIDWKINGIHPTQGSDLQRTFKLQIQDADVLLVEWAGTFGPENTAGGVNVYLHRQVIA